MSGSAPIVVKVSPDKGLYTRGATVTIEGAGFVAGTTTVVFGTYGAAAPLSVEPAKIVVLAPARAEHAGVSLYGGCDGDGRGPAGFPENLRRSVRLYR